MMPFPSPTVPAAGRTEVFLRYLDYFRENVLTKVSALAEDELRRSRLPSGWTPLEVLKHLRYVELRSSGDSRGAMSEIRGVIGAKTGGTSRRRRLART